MEKELQNEMDYLITQVAYLMSMRGNDGTALGYELTTWANIINSALRARKIKLTE